MSRSIATRAVAASLLSALVLSCAGSPAAPAEQPPVPPPAEPGPPAPTAPRPDAASPADAASAPAATSAPDGASPADAGSPPPLPVDAASARKEVLVFTRSTGYRHDNIEPAAESIRTALVGRGWQVQLSADAGLFSTTGLARFAGVVLLSTTGTPLGEPPAAQSALEAWVRGGGALIGIHAASSSDYPSGSPYLQLLGGKFIDHPGGVRAAACHPEGTHPAAAQLPPSFQVRDEIYRFEAFRSDNTVVLRCDEVSGNGRLPIAWHRQEGEGRVFYSGLGHGTDSFAPAAVVWKDHLFPGILWALER